MAQRDDDDQPKAPWYLEKWFLYPFALFTTVFFIIAFVLNVVGWIQQQLRVGENVTNDPYYSQDGGGSQVTNDCNELKNLPPEYRQWLKEAADKYLGGDQAALWALIQVESNWKRTITNPGGAAGLGQFLPSTARGMSEFKGTPIYDHAEGHSDDGRFNAQKSIFAAARYFRDHGFKNGAEIGQAYGVGYHTGFLSKKPKIRAEAIAGANRLRRFYAQFKANCLETSSAPAPAVEGSYVSPIPTQYILASIKRNAKNYFNHHHYTNAVDIVAPTGTSLYAITSGTIQTTMHYRRNIYGSPRGTPGGCGTGFILKGDNGYSYTYCHMDTLNVKRGTRVNVGQQVGTSDNNGNSERPHLHITMSGKGATGRELRRQVETSLPANQRSNR